MEHSLDVQTRLENLIWTVSGNYDLGNLRKNWMKDFLKNLLISPFIMPLKKDVLKNILILRFLAVFLQKKYTRGWNPLYFNALANSVLTVLSGKRLLKSAKAS